VVRLTRLTMLIIDFSAITRRTYILTRISKEPLRHYKISQFYQRKNSIGVWLDIRRWFFYRRHHRRIMSVGFTFVGDSPFRRYIGRKNKKIICRWFYRRNLRAKKKIPAWNIPTNLYSVGKSVGECMKYRPNISVCKFVSTCGSYC